MKKVKASRRRHAAHAALPPLAPSATDLTPRLVPDHAHVACILCTAPASDHFSSSGRYVGCVALRRSGAAFFLPPVMLTAMPLGMVVTAVPDVMSTAMHFHRQPREAAPEVVQAGIVSAKQASNGAKRGRPAESIFPTVQAIPPDENPTTQHVFAALMQHAQEGVTLKTLVEQMGMPYSTVQAHVNKLLAANAAKKVAITASAT